jgi:hypothetical protein
MLKEINKRFVQGVLALAVVGYCVVYSVTYEIALDPAITGIIGTIVGYYFAKEIEHGKA